MTPPSRDVIRVIIYFFYIATGTMAKNWAECRTLMDKCRLDEVKSNVNKQVKRPSGFVVDALDQYRRANPPSRDHIYYEFKDSNKCTAPFFMAGVIENFVSLLEFTGRLSEPWTNVQADLEEMKTPCQITKRHKHGSRRFISLAKKCRAMAGLVFTPKKVKGKQKAKAPPAKGPELPTGIDEKIINTLKREASYLSVKF